MLQNIYERQDQKFLGLKISAIIETLLFLSLVTLGNFLFGDGTRFVTYKLHPFWIIVLLTAVQYGTAEGIFAAIMSTLFLYVGNVPKQTADELLFDYELHLGLLPALWFITAFVLGELRMRIEWENRQLKADRFLAKAEVDKITSEYLTLKDSYQNLSIYLTSQEETVAESFSVFRAIESLTPAQVIFGLNNIIQLSLHPQKFSVFAKGPSGLEAVTSEGWKDTDHYTLRFLPTTPLCNAIVNEKRIVSIVNKDDQQILGREGIIASPLVDPETGDVFGMIKVEDMDFRSLNLSRLETFRIVCELIGRAYSNARKHKSTKKSNIFADSTDLYSNSLYKILSKYQLDISKANEDIVHVLQLQLANETHFSHEFYVKLHNYLPKNVQCFEGSHPKRELLFLYVQPKSMSQKSVQEIKQGIEKWLIHEGGMTEQEIYLTDKILTQEM